MGALMDLVAGDAREILLCIGLDDWAALDDPRRFAAHLPLGAGLDPEWLDLLAGAAREAGDGAGPASFTGSLHPLRGSPSSLADGVVERVDPHWVYAVATLPDRLVDRVAARWLELLDEEGCEVAPDEKPLFRELVADLIAFCRRAEGAEDVILAWSI